MCRTIWKLIEFTRFVVRNAWSFSFFRICSPPGHASPFCAFGLPNFSAVSSHHNPVKHFETLAATSSEQRPPRANSHRLRRRKKTLSGRPYSISTKLMLPIITLTLSSPDAFWIHSETVVSLPNSWRFLLSIVRLWNSNVSQSTRTSFERGTPNWHTLHRGRWVQRLPATICKCGRSSWPRIRRVFQKWMLARRWERPVQQCPTSRTKWSAKRQKLPHSKSRERT